MKSKCLKCQQNRGKRYCSIFKGLICNLCCVQYRETEILCSGCIYLYESERYQKDKQIKQAMRDNSADRYLYTDKDLSLCLEIEGTIYGFFYCINELDDEDVLEALDYVERKIKGEKSDKTNTKLGEHIISHIEKYIKEKKDVSIEDQVRCVVRIKRSVLLHSCQKPGSRNYLRFISKELSKFLKVEEIIPELGEAFKFLDSGNFEQARTKLEKLLERKPKNANIYFGLGTYYALTEQYHQASRFLKRAIDLDSKNADYYFNLGGVYIKTLRTKGACKLLQRYLQLAPNGEHIMDAKESLDKITCAIECEKTKESHLTTEELLELGDIFYDGCDFLEQGDYEEALKCFERIVAVDKQSWSAYGNIGVSYYKMGELKKAKQYLEKSLSIDPNYEIAKINLFSITRKYPDFLTKTLERAFFENINETLSKLHYSVDPFLRASSKINIYGNFYELENFYYHNWEEQDLDKAMGLCQHLSYFTNKFLSDLVISTKKFEDYYDIYYATGVYESRCFNYLYGNHICLIVFGKGDKEKGWIIDPSLKVIKRCFEEPNCYRDIIYSNKVFTTNSDHKYLVASKIGSSIRKELHVKEDTFTHYSASFNSYLPLFIYENKSLILSKFQRKGDKVCVEYYEHIENGDFNQSTLIDKHTARYKQLYNYSHTFSLIDSLLMKVSIIDNFQIDQHQRLLSTELEENYTVILYYIELAIVQVFRQNPYLTDSIVANVLNDLISHSENEPYQLEYLKQKTEKIHMELKNRINSFNLESKCPTRILTNAFRQVLGSVNGFIKRDAASDAYLNFITGYYE